MISFRHGMLEIPRSYHLKNTVLLQTQDGLTRCFYFLFASIFPQCELRGYVTVIRGSSTLFNPKTYFPKLWVLCRSFSDVMVAIRRYLVVTRGLTWVFLQYYVTMRNKSYCYKQSELLIREGWAIPWKRNIVHFQAKLKARVFTDVTKVYNKVSRGKNINVRE